MASRHMLGDVLVVVVRMLCTLADHTDALESGCRKAEDCPCGPMAECKCKKGKCTFDCDHGWGNCDGNKPTLARPISAHCGSCKEVCRTPGNGTATCTHGKCGMVCDLEFMKCGKRCVNPVDFQSDTITITSAPCPCIYYHAACSNGTCGYQLCQTN